jgi:hypothetical protein
MLQKKKMRVKQNKKIILNKLSDILYNFRQLVFNQRQVLLEQLSSETDPAMALHLTSVILFHTYTQTLLHVPGKCVPQVILFLKSHMEADKYDELHKQQGKLLCYHYLIWILLK